VEGGGGGEFTEVAFLGAGVRKLGAGESGLTYLRAVAIQGKLKNDLMKKKFLRVKTRKKMYFFSINF